MTQPQTRNALGDTLKAIGEFDTALSDMQSIYNEIDSAIAELTGRAMISQSGQIFGNGTIDSGHAPFDRTVDPQSAAVNDIALNGRPRADQTVDTLLRLS